MSSSTTYATVWSRPRVEVMVQATSADVAVEVTSYLEHYVMILQPGDQGLLRPVEVTVQRDGAGYMVSDDFSDVYGEGESPEEALANYRHALAALVRVLTARETTLPIDLAKQLAVLRSVVPADE